MAHGVGCTTRITFDGASFVRKVSSSFWVFLSCSVCIFCSLIVTVRGYDIITYTYFIATVLLGACYVFLG